MAPIPSHGLSKADYGFHTVQKAPIPVHLQDPPHPFDWIVFAVIRRIQLQGQLSINNGLRVSCV